MAIKSIFRDFTLFVDGQLFTGDVSDVEIPKLRWKVDEYRGGGMDIPVEIKLGHEKIELGFTLTSHSDYIYQRYGLAQGNNKIFKFFGDMVDYDGTETGVQIEVHGFMRELDPGSIKPGDKTNHKVTVACDYMKHVIGNTTVLEIDALNKKFIVNGVDQSAQARQNLGMN